MRRVRAPEITPNIIDRAIAFFDPIRAKDRYQARMTMALAGGFGGYLGARRDRRATQEWKVTSGSADSDLLPDLPELRDRTRDLERNAPIGAGIINTGVTNIVGTGLVPQSMIDRGLLGLTDEQADEWQRAAEREWWLWAGSPECDLTRTQPHCDLQDLALRGVFGSGDIFAIRRYVERPGAVYGLKIQMVEADRVSNPNMQRDQTVLTDGHKLSGGCELDTDGAPVAYHILNRHPGDLSTTARKWDRIPAFGAQTNERQVLHLFKRRRPDQSRGIPLLAPVIEPLKQLSRLSESELMASVVSSFFTVFIKTPTGEDLNLASTASETGSSTSDDDVKLGTGAVVSLSDGESIETANPMRPNSNFEPFFLAICKEIGCAIEIPHELILKVFNSSYSASRAALLEAWKFFRVWRDWLAWNFCQPCYEWVIIEAVARGRLAAPGFFDDPLIRQAWLGTQWIGPPPGQLDPESEINAAEKRVEMGITTLQEETATLAGGDWESKHAQRVKEHRMRVDAGLEAVLPGTAAPQPAPAPPVRQSAAQRDRQATGS